jgi:HEAT repeat protein
MPLIRKTSDKPQTAATEAKLPGASADARWSAARDSHDVPALAQALACESEPRVREALFTALARVATPEAAAVLLPYIGSDAADIRTGALDALRAMPEATAQHLPRLLGDTDADVRLLACDLVRDMPGLEAPRLLCALIETEPQANVCAAAVEVLTEIGDADALPALSACAARFPADPFLSFAINAAAERIRAASRV